MSKFRPCIDIHDGKVKQIIGSKINEKKENFVSLDNPSHFANMYKRDKLSGGHVIMLGSHTQNLAPALLALKEYPNALQIGGGINHENARYFLENHASHIILSSCLFDEKAKLNLLMLKKIASDIGSDKIVIDLSAKKINSKWYVAINKWQKITDFELSYENLDTISKYCDEILIHAIDVEGYKNGMDIALIKHLSKWNKKKITYAGGANSIKDLEKIHEISNGKIDLTIGSALDIFGGETIKYRDCVAFNNRKK